MLVSHAARAITGESAQRVRRLVTGMFLTALKAEHPDVFAQGMLGMGLLSSLQPGSRPRRFGVRFLLPIALGDYPRLYQTGTTTRDLWPTRTTVFESEAMPNSTD